MTCAICDARGEDGERVPAAVDARRRWACDEPAPADTPVMWLDEAARSAPLRRCPWSFAVPRWAPVLPFLELAWTKGYLPAPGAMLDQTSPFVAALLCYGRASARVEREAVEDARQSAALKA